MLLHVLLKLLCLQLCVQLLVCRCKLRLLVQLLFYKCWCNCCFAIVVATVVLRLMLKLLCCVRSAKNVLRRLQLLVKRPADPPRGSKNKIIRENALGATFANSPSPRVHNTTGYYKTSKNPYSLRLSLGKNIVC